MFDLYYINFVNVMLTCCRRTFVKCVQVRWFFHSSWHTLS